jgi:hypothetical protein
MDSSFDLLSSVVLGRDSWRLKVRVARMWSVSSFLKPELTNSIEMVLVDEKVFIWFDVFVVACCYMLESI